MQASGKGGPNLRAAGRALLAGRRTRDEPALDASERNRTAYTVPLSTVRTSPLTASGKKQRPKETPGYIQVRNSRPRRGVLNEPSVQSKSHSWELSTSTRHQSVQARQRINSLIRAVEPFAPSPALCTRESRRAGRISALRLLGLVLVRATGAAVPVLLQRRIQ